MLLARPAPEAGPRGVVDRLWRPAPADGQRAGPRRRRRADGAGEAVLAAARHGHGAGRRRARVGLAVLGHAVPELVGEVPQPLVDGGLVVERRAEEVLRRGEGLVGRLVLDGVVVLAARHPQKPQSHALVLADARADEIPRLLRREVAGGLHAQLVLEPLAELAAQAREPVQRQVPQQPRDVAPQHDGLLVRLVEAAAELRQLLVRRDAAAAREAELLRHRRARARHDDRAGEHRPLARVVAVARVRPAAGGPLALVRRARARRRVRLPRHLQRRLRVREVRALLERLAQNVVEGRRLEQPPRGARDVDGDLVDGPLLHAIGEGRQDVADPLARLLVDAHVRLAVLRGHLHRDQPRARLARLARLHLALDAGRARLVAHGDEARAAGRDAPVVGRRERLRVLLPRLVLAHGDGQTVERRVARALHGDVEAVHVDEADAGLVRCHGDTCDGPRERAGAQPVSSAWARTSAEGARASAARLASPKRDRPKLPFKNAINPHCVGAAI